MTFPGKILFCGFWAKRREVAVNFFGTGKFKKLDF